jgi:hypothetical protein
LEKNMKFLKITATDGTQNYIPDGYVVSVKTAADTLDAGSAYSAPKVIRGRITGVTYYDGANATAGALVVVTVAARGAGVATYEYGCKTDDGAFSVAMSN